MAVLSDVERAQITAEIESDISRTHTSIGSMLSADIRAAVNATDDWYEGKAAEYNVALPASARSNLTANQKNELSKRVADARWGG